MIVSSPQKWTKCEEWTRTNACHAECWNVLSTLTSRGKSALVPEVKVLLGQEMEMPDLLRHRLMERGTYGVFLLALVSTSEGRSQKQQGKVDRSCHNWLRLYTLLPCTCGCWLDSLCTSGAGLAARALWSCIDNDCEKYGCEREGF